MLGPGWVRAGPGPAPVRRQLYTLVRAHSLGTRAAEHAGSCAAPLHRHTPHTLCRYAALHCSLRIISTDFFPTIRVDHASGIRMEVLLRSRGTGTEADLAGKFYSRDENVSNHRLIFLFCYLQNVCKK